MTTRFLSRFLTYNSLLFTLAVIHLYISTAYGNWVILFDTTVISAVLAALVTRYESSK